MYVVKKYLKLCAFGTVPTVLCCGSVHHEFDNRLIHSLSVTSSSLLEAAILMHTTRMCMAIAYLFKKKKKNRTIQHGKGRPSVSTLSPFEVTGYLQGISPVPLPILELRRVHHCMDSRETSSSKAAYCSSVSGITEGSTKGTVVALLKTHYVHVYTLV